MSGTGTARSGSARWIAALAASGAGLGLLLSASRAGAPAGGCSASARHLGCLPGALTSLKPYVAGGMIGLLLGVLIAIAAVLAWREALSAVGEIRARETGWMRPSALAAGRADRQGGRLRPQARH